MEPLTPRPVSRRVAAPPRQLPPWQPARRPWQRPALPHSAPVRPRWPRRPSGQQRLQRPPSPLPPPALWPRRLPPPGAWPSARPVLGMLPHPQPVSASLRKDQPRAVLARVWHPVPASPSPPQLLPHWQARQKARRQPLPLKARQLSLPLKLWHAPPVWLSPRPQPVPGEVLPPRPVSAPLSRLARQTQKAQPWALHARTRQLVPASPPARQLPRH
mmetsp:Transcript_15480/g.44355  ORF Transcript_15480/g.44355 Transcript_15480/m.44355 type:complete len:216 (+) Transcript_15480:472-1119(+)